ncbi:ATP-binding protein [Massilia sp. GCM10020059]|uniref:Oxygen sensor histidine kinase NreB n=1 Tax=Massilia agrisoli TaxID=2892444 RepID=A0ABS8ITM6_9BURK|nr:ATP-binding protein [Massilia agrisoli]MCC6071987.1 PAS domain-containing protein [Massilia agrisoli]
MPSELNCVTLKDNHDVPRMFAGEGEMVRRVNEHDWEDTPLGPVSGWPDSIRAAVSIALGSNFQLVVLSGPELVYIYNDASICIFGEKHPWALGKPTSLVWSEAWATLGPMLHSVLDTGRALRHDDLLLVLQRYGYVEECYFTFSYSPIRSDDGIAGVFISVIETSERVVNERRLRTLGELAARVASGRGEQVYAALAEALSQSLDDLPCAALYLVEPGQRAPRTVFHTGVEGGCIHAAGPAARAFATGQVQEFDASEMLAGDASYGIWPERPRHGLAYPLMLPGARQACGVFVIGVNPRKALDAAHRTFLDFVAGHVATAIANAEAARIERERMTAMAELNRSRSAFFANASHELRTPLTLILGPLEGLLESPGAVADGAREPLEMARRNALRMKRLVNSLLDFASIEAGRMQVRMERTDLAQVTLGLASLFRPSFDSAGVAFAASVPPHPVDVLIDLEMWEKVVLNLLSNALKFTPQGKVELALREDDGVIVLSVSDTGVGIGAHDLPHIFERFYRGAHHSERAGAEGSGLGLALASELVRLLDGSLEADSAEGVGTTIAARIPARRAAPGNDGADLRAEIRLNAQGEAIVADARRAADARAARAPAGAPPAAAAGAGLIKAVVIDDNADVVRYLECLLQPWCAVATAGEAAAGLDAVRRIRPDIVLLDVMMPGIDGFELLRTIRGDEAIQSIPVIILSAHAGEDARLEALAAGADDYLVKPFSARELVAMVHAHVKLVRTRRALAEREAHLLNQIAEVSSDLESVMEGTSDAFLSVDPELRIVAIKKIRSSLLNEAPEAMIGRQLPDVEPEFAPVADALLRAMRERRTVGLHFLHRPSERWFSVRCYPGGKGAIAFANEITRQKNAEARLRQAHAELETRVLERTRDLDTANALLEAVFDRSPAGIVMADFDGRIVRANAAFERLVGVGGQQLKALTIERLADPADAALSRMLVEQLRAGQTDTFLIEMRYRRPDGSVTWAENFVGTINGDDGKPRYIVKIVQDISSRKAAADEILASRNELRFLYDWLQHVRKDERIALAREVHDQLGQILSAAKIDIKLLLEDIQASSGALPRRKLVAELNSASDTLDQAIDSARSIAMQLRPPAIQNQGLYSALAWHARDFERRTRVAVALDLPADRGGPACPGGEALFRIFMEALTNILRHARASSVSVCAQRRGQRMLLRVRDNGVGIPAARVRAPGTLGLVGMRERAELVHGRVGIRRLRSGGTLLSALVPVSDFRET